VAIDGDLAVANAYSNSVSVLLGNGNGTFGAAVLVSAGVSGGLLIEVASREPHQHAHGPAADNYPSPTDALSVASR